MRFGGSTRRSYLVLVIKYQSPVAEAWFSARKRASGINEMSLLLDTAHPALAGMLTNTLIHQLTELSPGRRIEMFLPSWQDKTIEAAKNAGFTIRCEGCLMGKMLYLGLLLH